MNQESSNLKLIDAKKDPETRVEIERLRDSQSVGELERRLRDGMWESTENEKKESKNRAQYLMHIYTHIIGIQFGTAGLRGRMAAGFTCMNSLTVIQASQGLAKYLTTKHPETASSGVIIGHDARHNSAKFAALAANAFIAEKIPVYLYTGPCITPTVPFGVLHLHTAAGIMVTASHVCWL